MEKRDHKSFLNFSRGAHKRGQLTFFVIVALVFVVAILLYYFTSEPLPGQVNHEVKPAYDGVSLCVDNVIDESLYYIGSSGGYYDLPEKVDEQSIAYHYYEGQNLMPPLATIESEIEKYVGEMLGFCIEDKNHELKGYEIISGDIEVDVDVRSDDRVYFKVDAPFAVTRDNNSFYFDEPFLRVLDVRLYTIYSFLEGIMVEQEKESRAFCMNCVGDRAFEEGLIVDLWTFNPNDVIFIVIDEDSQVNGGAYHFFYANKYPEENTYDPFENF